MKFKIASVNSFIIEFESKISQEVSNKVKFYFDEIQKYENIIDIVPSYTSILISFDIFKTSRKMLQKKISSLNYEQNHSNNKTKTITIPVYYGVEVGLDLQRISKHHHISIEEIIRLHTSQIYTVFTIGFSPGFAYLGDVNKKIAMPRLDNPRKIIQKGSVAIADTQTAIYPNNSPGGWNIIGRTSFTMFNKELETLCPVSIGDKIKFQSISKKDFLDLGGTL